MSKQVKNTTSANNKSNKSASRRRRDMERFITKRSVRGGRISVPTNPPEVTTQPWNQVTIVYEMSAEFQRVEHIRNRLLEQLDVEGTTFYSVNLWNDKEAGNKWQNIGGEKPRTKTYQISAPAINLKIHSIRVWNLTGKAVSLSVYDYSNSSIGDERLAGLVDTGGPSSFPAIGYQLPLSLHDYVIRTSDSKTSTLNVFNVTAAAGDRIVAYVKVEWKPDSKQKDLMINFDYNESVVRQITETNELIHNLTASSSNLEKSMKKVSDSQPSTFRKVLDGVATTAAIVLPIVAEGRKSELASENDLITHLLRRVSLLESAAYRSNNILETTATTPDFEEITPALLEHTAEDEDQL